MIAFRDGENSAFDELVSLYADRVFSFTKRILGDESLAEDAAQETFIKVWKHKKSFDGKRSFSPWLFRIARNTTLDIIRKKKDLSFSKMSSISSDEEFDFADTIADDGISVPDSFDISLLNTALEDALELLTPDQKSVVIFHDVEGLTFEEIGEVMSKPMNTVKSHYRRAIAALRTIIADKGFV